MNVSMHAKASFALKVVVSAHRTGDHERSLAIKVLHVSVRKALAMFLTKNINKNNYQWVIRTGFTLVDQLIFSGTNFLLNVLLARWLSLGEYGAFSVAFSVFLFLAGIHNALIIEPLQVFGQTRFVNQLSSYLRQVWLLQFILTVFLAMFMIMSSSITINNSDIYQALLWMGGSTPIILSNWYMRRVFYLFAEAGKALACSITHALLLYGALILTVKNASLTIDKVYAILSAASLVIVFASMLLQSRFRTKGPKIEITCVISDHWRFGRWLALATVFSLGTGQLQTVLAASLLGLEEAAVLRVMLNFTTPPLQFITAIAVLAMPRIAITFDQYGIDAAQQFTQKLSRLLFFVVTFYTLALFVFGKDIDLILFAGKFSKYLPVLYLIGIVPLFSSLAVGYSLLLRAEQRTASLFVISIVSGSVGLISSILSLWIGLWGAAISVVLTYISSFAVSMLFYLRK